MKFTYSNTTQIHFGQGQIAALGTLIPASSKVLLLYGTGSIVQNGVYQQVTAALQAHQTVEFGGIPPNPTHQILESAVRQISDENIDFILAVGGGSIIDSAKYVAAAAKYEGNGWDILKRRAAVHAALPLGAVLTLPATGSESNAAAVVSDSDTNEKLMFLSPLIQPQFAVMDPDVSTSLPLRQIANGLVDAWVHTCEQYLTFPAGALIQDGYAEALLRTLATLGDNIEHRDENWRANFMWAANQALNGLLGAGVAQDWATHMIGHQLTALYGVDHARSLAIVQPSLLRHQLANKRAKLQQMGQNVFALTPGKDLAERTIDAIERFYNNLGVATQLTEHNCSKAQAIDAITANLKRNGMARLGEHRTISIRHCREILATAIP